MAPKFKLQLAVPEKDSGADAHSDVLNSSLSDSWKINANGALEMLSKSFNPYQFSSDGLIKTSGNQHYKVSQDDIVTIKTLGRGASSLVYKGFLHTQNRFVAVKKISIFEKDMRQQVMNDVKALCDAPNEPGLVQFCGAFHAPDSGQVCIVLEFMNAGSLADVLHKVGCLPEPELACVTAAVLGGLAQLHRRKMVHRDIKPANILLDCKGGAKISDFGISAFVDSTLAQCHTFTGTVTYMSPERINNLPYSFPADIWSLGMVLLECVLGRYPYDATRGPVELMLQLMQEEAPLPPEGACSPELRDLLARCLRKDPHQRPSAQQLLEHPFLVKHRPDAHALRPFMLHHMHDPVARLDEVAFMFSWNYYRLMSQGVAGLAQLGPLYTDASRVAREGQAAVGVQPVLGLLQSMAVLHDSWGGVAFHVRHVDCQPLGPDGSALVLVHGTLGLQNGAGGLSPFAETFVLSPSPEGGEFCISRQAFRLLK